MKDTYLTISKTSIGQYKEKGSKFIACIYPFDTEEQLKEILTKSKKKHLKSCHHCYAYRIGTEGKRFRANDDGEPSGTAGRPILGQIDRLELTNILLVVVRYYGGTKLGTSGLKRAYKEASKDALEQANIIEKIKSKRYTIEFDYAITSEIMQLIKSASYTIVDTNYGDNTTLTLEIRDAQAAQFLHQIKAFDKLRLG